MRLLPATAWFRKRRTEAARRPICPICERPMERRASTVWMCPDFPRCPGSAAAD